LVFKISAFIGVYLRFIISHRGHREHRVFINRGWTQIHADLGLDRLGLLVGFYNICVHQRLSAVKLSHTEFTESTEVLSTADGRGLTQMGFWMGWGIGFSYILKFICVLRVLRVQIIPVVLKISAFISVYLRFIISHRVHREHRVFINRGWTRINADVVLDGLGVLIGFYNICVHWRLSAVCFSHRVH
jgi:hypothetical protein